MTERRASIPGTVDGKPVEGVQKATRHINRKPSANLKKAVQVAKCIRKPLNRSVSVNCYAFEHDDEETSRRLRFLLSRHFGPWIRRPRQGLDRTTDGPPAFVWTIENPDEGSCNFHWIVHVPRDRWADFEEKVYEWVTKCFGPPNPRTIHITHSKTPQALVKYILKGMDEVAASTYGIQHVAQGTVIGKRSGYSKSIGPTVRKRLEAEGRMKKTRYTPFAP